MNPSSLYQAPELPEDSVLSLSEYLDVQRAVADETRYRVLAELLREGEVAATDLPDALDVPNNRLHHHLNELVDAGLVHNRKRKERGADGLYSYYVPTALGQAVMAHGVGELIAEERELLTRYA